MTIFSEWISATDAAEVLRSSPAAVKRLGDQGHVRTHQLPGGRRRYLFEDVVNFLPVNAKAVPPPTRNRANKRTASASA